MSVQATKWYHVSVQNETETVNDTYRISEEIVNKLSPDFAEKFVWNSENYCVNLYVHEIPNQNAIKVAAFAMKFLEDSEVELDHKGAIKGLYAGYYYDIPLLFSRSKTHLRRELKNASDFKKICEILKVALDLCDAKLIVECFDALFDSEISRQECILDKSVESVLSLIEKLEGVPFELFAKGKICLEVRDPGCDHFSEAVEVLKVAALYINLDQILPEEGQIILESLANNDSLTEIYISGGELSDEIALALGTIVRNCPIENLILKNCRLTASQITILSPALHACKTLEKIDFSNNQLDEKSAYCIAEIFDEESEVEELILRGNNFGSEGGFALSRCLDALLTHLDLSNCHIGEGGVKAILYRVASHLNLERLNLSGNYIDDEIVNFSRTILKRNDCLKELELSNWPKHHRLCSEMYGGN